MQLEQFVPWEEGMEEFVFPSHTALISKDLLLSKLQVDGLDHSKIPKKKKMNDEEANVLFLK